MRRMLKNTPFHLPLFLIVNNKRFYHHECLSLTFQSLLRSLILSQLHYYLNIQQRCQYDQKKGHIMLNVENLEKMLKFYTETLGFVKAEQVGVYTFLKTNNDSHHDLAFCKSTERNNFEHLAFELESISDLENYCNKLKTLKIAFERYDYGIGECIYFDDPEGNCLELFADLRKERNVTKWDGQFEPK